MIISNLENHLRVTRHYKTHLITCTYLAICGQDRRTWYGIGIVQAHIFATNVTDKA